MPVPPPVKPIPDGYHSLTPYLIVHDGAAALDFYARAFGGTELFRMPGPGGRIGHAEMRIGDSVVMIADPAPDKGGPSPRDLGGTPVSLLLYVEDVDAVFARAVAAGGTATRPVRDQFYGDRMGTLTDPFGHHWHIATHREDVTPEEMARRSQAQGQGY